MVYQPICFRKKNFRKRSIIQVKNLKLSINLIYIWQSCTYLKKPRNTYSNSLWIEIKKDILKYTSISKINEYCDSDLDFNFIYLYRILTILSNSKCSASVSSFGCGRLVHLATSNAVRDQYPRGGHTWSLRKNNADLLKLNDLSPR